MAISVPDAWPMAVVLLLVAAAAAAAV